MRICPICQWEYSDPVEICPREGARLERYDLRADLRARRNREMFAPLAFEPLASRLGREIANARRDFASHPRLFLLGILRGDNDPHYRRSLLRSAAFSLIAINAFLSALILIAGSLRPASAERETENVARPDHEFFPLVRLVRVERSQAKGERGGRSRAAAKGSSGEEGNGGGGGGTRSAQPARRGGPPEVSMLPQIITPRIDLARVEHASLIYPMTIQADPRAVPPVASIVGDPESASTAESGGPGRNDGLGSGRNGGIGTGAGPGIGDGANGNTGGGGSRPGRPGRAGEEGGIPWASDQLKPRIIYKEKARYTEDARSNQVQGTVVLRATFSADGEVTDIRVVRGLPDGLTEMAILAAQRIRFQPAMRNGVPVSVRASLEYNFVLY